MFANISLNLDFKGYQNENFAFLVYPTFRNGNFGIYV